MFYSIGDSAGCANPWRNQGFIDGDISCPIPHVPEAVFGDFNWFVAFIRHARLLSRLSTSLFSAAVSDKPSGYYLDAATQLAAELEDWRESLPDTGFRPGGSVRPQDNGGTQDRFLALHIHYLYHSMSLTLSRTCLHHLPEVSSDPATPSQRKEILDTFLGASRAILDLTSMIEIEPYTAAWLVQPQSLPPVP
jgi:hypothetical protein